MKKIILLVLMLIITVYASGINAERMRTGVFKFHVYGHITNGHIKLRVPYQTDYQKTTIANINKDENGGFVRAKDQFSFEGTVHVDYSQISIQEDEKIGNHDREFLKETKKINPENEGIQKIISTMETDNLLETVKQATEFSYNYIDYDSSMIGKDPLSTQEILDWKRGVCVEYAILEASILRAKGIPTKHVIGFVQAGNEFLPHAWIEFYSKNHGWLPADPTKNQMVHIDATHIKIAEGADPTDLFDKIFYRGLEADYQKEYDITIENWEKFEKIDAEIDIDPEYAGFGSSSNLIVNAMNEETEMKFITTLVLNDEFVLINEPSKIIMLNPNEEKKYIWQIDTIDQPVQGKTITHTLKLKSQAIEGGRSLFISDKYEKNIRKKIEIKRTAKGEDNKIKVTLGIKNTGSENLEDVKITVLEEKLSPQTITTELERMEEKSFDFYFVKKPDVNNYNFEIRINYPDGQIIKTLEYNEGLQEFLKTEYLIGAAIILGLIFGGVVIGQKLRKVI